MEEREEETLEAETSAFLESEMFSDLNELEDKLRTGGLSVTGFDGIRRNDALFLCFIELTDSRIPQMPAALVIEESLEYSLFVRGTVVSPRQYKHICSKILLVLQRSSFGTREER